MKQYFIPEININVIPLEKLKKNNKFTKKTYKKILALDGEYIINTNGETIHYRINDMDNEDVVVKDYLDKYTLCIAKYNKKRSNKKNIPVNSNEINMDSYVFKSNDKSQTSMIIEVIKNNIKDMYFLSNLDYDDYSFKEDISYLLLKLIL